MISTWLLAAYKNSVPTEYALYQNYPNPFNPSTKISWQLPVRCHTTIMFYNVLGKEIVGLVNDDLKSGIYNVIFSPTDGERRK